MTAVRFANQRMQLTGRAFWHFAAFLQATDGVAVTLEKPEIRQLGGRSFVVARELKDDPYKITKQRYGGSAVWVPVDSITQLVELAPLTPEK